MCSFVSLLPEMKRVPLLSAINPSAECLAQPGTGMGNRLYPVRCPLLPSLAGPTACGVEGGLRPGKWHGDQQVPVLSGAVLWVLNIIRREGHAHT